MDNVDSVVVVNIEPESSSGEVTIKKGGQEINRMLCYNLTVLMIKTKTGRCKYLYKLVSVLPLKKIVYLSVLGTKL